MSFDRDVWRLRDGDRFRPNRFSGGEERLRSFRDAGEGERRREREDDFDLRPRVTLRISRLLIERSRRNLFGLNDFFDIGETARRFSRLLLADRRFEFFVASVRLTDRLRCERFGVVDLSRRFGVGDLTFLLGDGDLSLLLGDTDRFLSVAGFFGVTLRLVRLFFFADGDRFRSSLRFGVGERLLRSLRSFRDTGDGERRLDRELVRGDFDLRSRVDLRLSRLLIERSRRDRFGLIDFLDIGGETSRRFSRLLLAVRRFDVFAAFVRLTDRLRRRVSDVVTSRFRSECLPSPLLVGRSVARLSFISLPPEGDDFRFRSGDLRVNVCVRIDQN